MNYKLYNTNFTGSKVVIPDLGIRLEPGGETDITDEDVSRSTDLSKAIEAKLVTLRASAFNASNRPIANRPIKVAKEVYTGSSPILTASRVANIYNIREAIFIKQEGI
jgi:hypothetical protein